MIEFEKKLTVEEAVKELANNDIIVSSLYKYEEFCKKHNIKPIYEDFRQNILDNGYILFQYINQNKENK